MNQSVKQAIGIILGTFIFAILAGIIGKIFEKSPEQIAKEKCLGIVKVAKQVTPDPVPITITVKGKTYQCQ
ncbi:MAG TPA: hypothetical protein VK203_15415 [Nostocaceae cyanobacterium]|nr:hypothetical protein [Nostocaceae cyanobacterium]